MWKILPPSFGVNKKVELTSTLCLQSFGITRVERAARGQIEGEDGGDRGAGCAQHGLRQAIMTPHAQTKMILCRLAPNHQHSDMEGMWVKPREEDAHRWCS